MPVKADTILAEARLAGVRTPKLPDVPPSDSSTASTKKESASTTTAAAPAKQPTAEDEFEALARRFEALKKR